MNMNVIWSIFGAIKTILFQYPFYFCFNFRSVFVLISFLLNSGKEYAIFVSISVLRLLWF